MTAEIAYHNPVVDGWLMQSKEETNSRFLNAKLYATLAFLVMTTLE